MAKTVRLNCDLGESFSIYKLCDEQHIIPLIDQANIACGFHAGDPSTISASIDLCVEHNVDIGAHPAYPDLQGFGRRSMALDAKELEDCLLYQLAALTGLAQVKGTKLSYVKPHGALYNDMMKIDSIFNTVLSAIAKFDNKLALMLLSTPKFAQYQQQANQKGIKLIFEAFADRRYTEQGSLAPRSEKGAVLNEQAAITQATQFIQGEVGFPVDSICVHGDTESAIALVRKIRTLL